MICFSFQMRRAAKSAMMSPWPQSPNITANRKGNEITVNGTKRTHKSYIHNTMYTLFAPIRQQKYAFIHLATYCIINADLLGLISRYEATPYASMMVWNPSVNLLVLLKVGGCSLVGIWVNTLGTLDPASEVPLSSAA